MKRPPYNQLKATEAVAHLLNSAPGKCEYLILIIKMLYIAERRAFQRWGRLITWDRFVSMDHGPVPSQTYNLISGSTQNSEIWDKYISDSSFHKIYLKEMPICNELSRAEIKLLAEVYNEYGAKDRWAVVHETHLFSEWKDPHGSAIELTLEDILEANHTPPQRVNQIRDELEDLANAHSVLDQF